MKIGSAELRVSMNSTYLYVKAIIIGRLDSTGFVAEAHERFSSPKYRKLQNNNRGKFYKIKSVRSDRESFNSNNFSRC